MARPSDNRIRRATLGLMAFAALLAQTARAEAPAQSADSPPSASSPAPEEWFAIHGQATYVEQRTFGFRSPYIGPNSLTPHQAQETVDATLFLGARMWRGSELWVNPELDQGFGLNDTVGVAGFPSGEAYKIGSHQPRFRVQRLFVRQTFNLGADRTRSDAGTNQFAEEQSSDRIVVTLGKFSVVDVFDTNRYAHDSRADFLNWSVIDAGSFDYAADAWGYTVGAAIEWYTDAWTWRTGVFDLSDVPNSKTLELGGDEYQINVELEHRHELFGLPGRLAVTAFESRARMALLQDAVDYALATGGPVDPAPVRRYRKRNGISLNLEQALSRDLGAFARIGGAGGNVETYEFTDIDRTFSAGLSLQGRRWHRPDDTVGLAGVINTASDERLRYLAAGGLGILVGDGQLPHPGHEKIIESYYEATAASWLHLALDYQWVGNPAYNRDRGPVSIIAARVHVQF